MLIVVSVMHYMGVPVPAPTICCEEFRDWRTSFRRGKQLSTDLSKAYELLGVKPGVSSRELKAAHRDLAKVWHPDRFLHDPRLQEKAQEKLKEINEAYEQISSGKVPLSRRLLHGRRRSRRRGRNRDLTGNARPFRYCCSSQSLR